MRQILSKVNTRKELKVGNTPVKAYLEDAYPLTVALVSERNYEWFFSNYIQLVFQDPNRFDNQPLKFYKLSLNSGYVWDAECPAIKYEYLSRDLLLSFSINIVELICKSIDNGKYPVVFLDEFYLPYREEYNKQHYIHESLFYGYDMSKKQLKGLNYVTESGRYEFISFSVGFDNIQMSYEDIEYTGEFRDRIALLSLKNERRFQFHPDTVKRSIKEYLSSYPSERRYFEISDRNIGKDFCYGMEIYDALIQCLFKKDQMLTVIPFQLLCEHKEVMELRFQFMVENHYIENDSAVETGLSELVKETRLLKLLFLRYWAKRTESNLRRIEIELKRIQEKERTVLNRFVYLVDNANKDQLIYSRDDEWGEIDNEIPRINDSGTEICFSLHVFSKKTMGYIVLSTHEGLLSYKDVAKLVVEARNDCFCIDGADGQKRLPGLSCDVGKYEVLMRFDFANEKYYCEVTSGKGERSGMECKMKKYDSMILCVDRIMATHDYSYRFGISDIKTRSSQYDC